MPDAAPALNATLVQAWAARLQGRKSFFQDKTVWVTGASSGIGEALVHLLAALGSNVVLSARRAEVLEHVRKAAGLTPNRSWVVPLDLAEPEQVRAAAGNALQAIGPVDVLIHNGGISQRSLALETDLAVTRQLLETNVLGTIALTHAVAPGMLLRGNGQIVVVSSLVGVFGTPLRSSYSASKHALHGYFDSLRAELPKNIAVTLICPGFIRTAVSINAVTADGSLQGKMDRAQEQGMPAETCAGHMLRAIARRKREVYIGGRETMGVWLKRYVPGVFAKVVRKAQVT